MTLYGLNLTKGRNAKLDVIMEDDECLLTQAMLPIYAKMRAVEG